MSKPQMKYKTTVVRNPATKAIVPDRRSPHIVGLRIYNEDELVEFALGNNYIEGAKFELAKGIVKGVVEAERAIIQAGNAVRIDGWMKYVPILKGSVDAEKRTLTKNNKLLLRIKPLKAMKLTLDSFSWQCVDGEADKPSAPAPTITGAGTRGDGAGMVNIAGATLEVTGENLDSATAVELLDASGEVWQTVPATFADGKLTATLDFNGKPSDTGAVRVTTTGGSATFDVTYAEH